MPALLHLLGDRRRDLGSRPPVGGTRTGSSRLPSAVTSPERSRFGGIADNGDFPRPVSRSHRPQHAALGDRLCLARLDDEERDREATLVKTSRPCSTCRASQKDANSSACSRVNEANRACAESDGVEAMGVPGGSGRHERIVEPTFAVTRPCLHGWPSAGDGWSGPWRPGHDLAPDEFVTLWVFAEATCWSGRPGSFVCLRHSSKLRHPSNPRAAPRAGRSRSCAVATAAEPVYSAGCVLGRARLLLPSLGCEFPM